MVTVSRRDFLPLLALILVPAAFSMLVPNPIQTGETPSFLLAANHADEEFGIVCPGSETEPPTERGRVGNCSERPKVGRRV